ncbi:MAG: histidinol-phosphate aminotransferase, chloroplastic-like [Caulobacteraceae bacterium]|nr:histidinol-phosphate aminotransferase, chloroplastic-like [Caulobacteraceae bacterium]
MDRPTPKAGILDIAPYVPGKAGAKGVINPVKLSANENPLGCSPKAKAAYIAAAERLFLYPDGRANSLREAVSRTYGLEPERLIFGCGSDEVFEDLCQTYLEPGDNIVQGEHGFLAYAVFAKACQAEVRYAPQTNLRPTAQAVLDQVDERTRIIFLDNPSNPTGAIMLGEEVEALHAGLPPNVILVLDGAYSEFADDPGFDGGFDLARRSNNVVVTRTFSKLHGLAAARVGWGYCPAEMVEAMDRIRQPFNLTIAGMEAAIAALSDVEFQQRSIELVRSSRLWLTQQLGGIGLEVAPSQANFVLVRFPDTPGRTANEAEAFLASHGLIVRGVAAYGLPEYLRITIGLEEQNRAVVETLGAFMATRAP